MLVGIGGRWSGMRFSSPFVNFAKEIGALSPFFINVIRRILREIEIN